jgi:hypothetical protein
LWYTVIDGDLLPVVTVSFQIPDLFLQLLDLDSLLLTRFASGEGVPCSLHSVGIVEVLNNDG